MFILVGERVLCMLFSGQNHIISATTTFSITNGKTEEKAQEKLKIHEKGIYQNLSVTPKHAKHPFPGWNTHFFKISCLKDWTTTVNVVDVTNICQEPKRVESFIF